MNTQSTVLVTLVLGVVLLVLLKLFIDKKISSGQTLFWLAPILGGLVLAIFPSLIDRLESGDPFDKVSVSNIFSSDTLDVPVIEAYPGLARPYVKIQDGCNEICSFCKIPQARGRNRSAPRSLGHLRG